MVVSGLRLGSTGSLVSMPAHIAAGCLLGPARGSRWSQTTVYKSVGVAGQDAVAANLVLKAARERGSGTEVEWQTGGV